MSNLMTLFVILIFIPILTCILLCLNLLLAPKVTDTEKISVYEAGMQPVSGPRSQFQISFYMVAILFLVFDLEISVFFPVATILKDVSIYGFSVAMIFILILVLGFFYEYGSGAINFTRSTTEQTR